MNNLKERIKKCEQRIARLEELNAPTVLIENEKNWLRKLRLKQKFSK